MTGYRLSRGCACGNVQVLADLSMAVEGYQPRRCDCDFCMQHGAAYLSDPAGTLHITVQNPGRISRYRQGNQLADFLICSSCQELICVVYTEASGKQLATLNVQPCLSQHAFAEPQMVSPKQLNAAEKTARWSTLWFPLQLSGIDIQTCPVVSE